MPTAVAAAVVVAEVGRSGTVGGRTDLGQVQACYLIITQRVSNARKAQEQCESRGGRPGLPVSQIVLTVSVEVTLNSNLWT